MIHILKILKYLTDYKKYGSLNILFNLLTAIFTILSFLVLKPFLDILFVEQIDAAVLEPASDLLSQIKFQFNTFLIKQIQINGKSHALLVVALIVSGTFLLKNLFRYLALFFIAPIRYGIEKKIRQKVFNHILDLPINFFNEKNKGDIISRVSSDVQEIQWSMLQSLETIVRSPLLILGSFSVMIYISPALTLFSFCLVLIVGVIIGNISKNLKKKSNAAQNSLGKMLSILDETIKGIKIIRIFNAEKYASDTFRQENDFYKNTLIQIMRRKDLSSPLTEFLAIIVVAALLVYGGNLVFRGDFSASTFVIFITMFYNIIDPAKSFSNSYYSIQKGSAAIDRIEELLNINNDIKNEINAESMPEFSKDIKFEQVNFSYDKDLVLNHINFSINKGETIAFVGGSGAGKSTIAQLIPRFWDTTAGEILFDGRNVKSYTLESLREKIAYVSQENILFNDSIRNNICFGTQEDSDLLAQAIQLACVDEFISDLKDGIDENIGENGLKLSGGQRQRIALARAIYRNRPILILDEATASLDYETEKIIQKNLTGLQSVTKIIIAHRISTIQDADKIFVLQKGQIVESGTHEQLIGLNMHYKKLYDLQNN